MLLPGAVLLLGTGGDQSSGMAPYLSGNGSNALTFLYTVADGDESVDLGTYEGEEAGAGGGLIGIVLRNSDAPTQVSPYDQSAILDVPWYFFVYFMQSVCLTAVVIQLLTSSWFVPKTRAADVDFFRYNLYD